MRTALFVLATLTILGCKIDDPEFICARYEVRSGFRPGYGLKLGGGFGVGAMTFQTWDECVEHRPNPNYKPQTK